MTDATRHSWKMETLDDMLIELKQHPDYHNGWNDDEFSAQYCIETYIYPMLEKIVKELNQQKS